MHIKSSRVLIQKGKSSPLYVPTSNVAYCLVHVDEKKIAIREFVDIDECVRRQEASRIPRRSK